MRLKNKSVKDLYGSLKPKKRRVSIDKMNPAQRVHQRPEVGKHFFAKAAHAAISH
jgi:hypothetical protein